MGATASKPIREAPVRYVAKQMPRMDKVPIEQQFKKPQYTAQGINSRVDDVNTEPLMYVETSRDGSATEVTDQTAPRWYLSTYMEMLDNMRVDQAVITGNFPYEWERDKFEPYSLVRDRIDHEDLQWVLAADQRKMDVAQLTEHTKLDRQTLQDILDTVELPRAQFRNYKGKLHHAITDANTHMAARQQQMAMAREAEALRQIGYSEEDIQKDEQYLTDRPRGVKALDDIGASRREKTRQERAAQSHELEDMLEDRRREQLESGTAEFTEEELLEKKSLIRGSRTFSNIPSNTYRRKFAADINKDKDNRDRFLWWLDRRRRIRRATDTIHGVPVYNERLSANEEQMRQQMQEAAEFNFTLGQSQGAKGFVDPRGHMDQMMDALRNNMDASQGSLGVNVYEDDVTQEHDAFRFPHTKDHPPRARQHIVKGREEEDKVSRVDTDIHKLYGFGRKRSGEEGKEDVSDLPSKRSSSSGSSGAGDGNPSSINGSKKDDEP